MIIYSYVRNNPVPYFDYSGLEVTAKSSAQGWNEDPMYGRTNNCYSHAMGKGGGRIFNRFGQGGGKDPGEYSGQRFDKMTCVDIKAAAMRDGAVEPSSGGEAGCQGECPSGYYKIRLVINEGKWFGIATDYHWFRQHKDESWTHKLGSGPVDWTTAKCPDRLNYDLDCGFLCVKN